MPSTRASSITRSIVRSLSRLAIARKARPARISGQSRARHRRSYSRRLRAGETIVAQRAGQHLGGNPAAEQAEVNAAAGRRLDQTGGIADGEHAA